MNDNTHKDLFLKEVQEDERNDYELLEKIRQLGVDPEIAKVIYDMSSGSMNDGYLIKRNYLAQEVSEFGREIMLGGCITRKKIEEIQEAINDFYKVKAGRLMPDQIGMIDTLPQKRYVIKSFPSYARATMGLTEGFHLIGAEDNVGKTAILIQLAIDILIHNENSRVWYFTLDDTGEKLSKRFLASLTYYLSKCKIAETSEINFANSYYENWDKAHTESKYDLKHKAMVLLKGFLGRKRLMVISGEHTEQSLKNELRECDKKNDIVMIDAVYNVDVVGGKMSSTNDIDGKRAKMCKDISKQFKVPVVCTKDARKGKNKGGDIDTDGTRIKVKIGGEDIAGSNKWKHEPDTIGTMWEEKQDTEGLTVKTKTKFTVMSMIKNKTDSFSPVMKFMFNGAKNTFQELKEKGAEYSTENEIRWQDE